MGEVRERAGRGAHHGPKGRASPEPANSPGRVGGKNSLLRSGGPAAGDDLSTPVKADPPQRSMPRDAVVCQGEYRRGHQAGWGSDTSRLETREVKGLNPDLAPRSKRGRPHRERPAARRGARAADNPGTVMQPPPGRPVRDGWPRAEGGQDLFDGLRLMIEHNDPRRTVTLCAERGPGRA
jgi:hypothetical protein